MCWKSMLNWPGTGSPANAVFTAPQLVWPTTLITSTSRMAAAYSRLAISTAVATLPATRTTNTSPKPWS